MRIGRRSSNALQEDGLRAGLLLSPAMLLLAACVLLPLGMMLVYSFWHMDGFSLVKEFSLGNYLYMLEQATFRRLIVRALLYGAVVAVLTVLLAYPIAYFMATRVSASKGLFVTAVIMPLYTSELIRYFSWRVILGTHGLLNETLITVGIIDEPIGLLAFSPVAVVIALTHVYLPFAILALWISLEAIDRALLEAAMDLGARPWRSFWAVTVPLSLPGVVAAVLFVFVPVTGEYFGINLMGGTSGITITNVINNQFAAAFNWPLGAALSFALLASVGLMVGGFLGLARCTRFARHYTGGRS